MAPEQFLARPTDARTDQFSFCVALYEALYGERPFPSESFSALARGGRQRPRSRARPEDAQRRRFSASCCCAASRRIRRRAIPSMRALLEVLRHDPIRRRRTLAIGAAMALVALIAAVGMQRVATRGQRMCGGAGEKLAGIWELGDHGERRERHSPGVSRHRARLRRGDLDARLEAARRLQPALDRDVHGYLRGDACPRRSVRRGAGPADDLPRGSPRRDEGAHRRALANRRSRAPRGGQRRAGASAARTLRRRSGASHRRAPTGGRRDARPGRHAPRRISPRSRRSPTRGSGRRRAARPDHWSRPRAPSATSLCWPKRWRCKGWLDLGNGRFLAAHQGSRGGGLDRAGGPPGRHRRRVGRATAWRPPATTWGGREEGDRWEKAAAALQRRLGPGTRSLGCVVLSGSRQPPTTRGPRPGRARRFRAGAGAQAEGSGARPPRHRAFAAVDRRRRQRARQPRRRAGRRRARRSRSFGTPTAATAPSWRSLWETAANRTSSWAATRKRSATCVGPSICPGSGSAPTIHGPPTR